MEEVEKSKKEIVIGFESDDSVAFMKKYLSVPSVSGFEIEGQRVWGNYMKQYVKSVELDTYGNCIARMGNIDSKYRVIIDSHSDIIGFMVKDIDSNGFLTVVKAGGVDPYVSMGSRVEIRTKNGIINGFFTTPAIHVHKSKVDVSIDNLFIDIGASSKEEALEIGIEIGNPVNYLETYFELNDNKNGNGSKWIVSRGLDDKISGFLSTEIAKRLFESNIGLDFQLIFLSTIQEENGLVGSEIFSKNNSNNGYNDTYIVLDVCHDLKSPHYTTKTCSTSSEMGGVLSVGTPIHNNFLNFIREVLDKNELPYQLNASANYTGTNSDIFYKNGSVTSLFSLATQNMHSCNEKVSKYDVEVVIQSIIAILKEIKEGQDFGYKL